MPYRRYLIDAHIPYQTDVPLSSICAMRCGGTAPLVAYPPNAATLAALLHAWDGDGTPYRVIGAMTNTLPPDGRLSYPLVSTCSMTHLTDHGSSVTAEAGVRLTMLAHRFMRMGRDVAAYLVTIPGTVGGAVRGNAGAFGHDMAEYVLTCEVYDPDTRATVLYSAADMAFSYRDSRLKHTRQILLSATLQARERDEAAMQEREAADRQWRREHQPTEPSLGSVFLRLPDGHSAAERIDAAGLKGLTFGGAAVSRRHAGFIINTGGASARDVRALIYYIQHRLAEQYGVHPSCEICILPKEESACHFPSNKNRG